MKIAVLNFFYLRLAFLFLFGGFWFFWLGRKWRAAKAETGTGSRNLIGKRPQQIAIEVK